MGYRGKLVEQQRARELRAQSWTLQEIADELGVAKASVSLWVRDVDFEPRPRSRGHPAGPKHPMRLKKEAELADARAEAEVLTSDLTERDLRMFALGLYAGEGEKTKGTVGLANTNPAYLALFVSWLRRDFEIDEQRPRGKIYLHEGLDIDVATRFWSNVTDVPVSQFTKPYRARANSSRRLVKHEHGCATVRYSCSRTLRRLLAMIEAVSFPFAHPG
jgi:transcriptional regulator with XRE-family HTH domain